jgi:diketogulonate reductase-like aldo/keto reductase
VSRLITPETLTGAKVPPNPRVWSGWLPSGIVIPCGSKSKRLSQWELHELCRTHGIVLLAFASLGHALEPRLLDDALIVSIARRLEKKPAQVLLAWGIQRGTAVLTGSVTPSRIKENFDVTALPESAIQEISERLETRRRFNSVVEGGEPGFAEVPSDR